MKRYQRHIPLFSEEEFESIRQSKIAVAGCGGLGSTVLQLMSRIGVGTIHFWDDAHLDLPDLNRQILYKPDHIGKLKSEIALKELKEINPEVNYIVHSERLNPKSEIPEVDLVLDCLDSFSSRLHLDTLFFAKGVPIIHGSIFQQKGQLTVLFPGKTNNYQNTFGIENEPEEQSIKTVYPPTVTSIASLQVNEALKCITKRYDQLLLHKLLIINLADNTFEIIPIT
jgi:molybdopterin/thiamine biosynthesis adenylyltransferase